MEFRITDQVIIRTHNIRTGYHLHPATLVGDEYVAEWEQYDGPTYCGWDSASVPAERVDALRAQIAEVDAAIEAERVQWEAQHTTTARRRNGNQRVERGSRTPRFRPSAELAQQRAALHGWQAL